MKQLFCEIPGITEPTSVSISNAHGNAVALCTIQCVDKTVDIGDVLTVDLGFTTDHGTVFNGYVKTLSRSVPDNSYTITAQDRLVQAVDYFIVGPGPDEPYNFGKGISAENLVNSVLNLAGLHIDYQDETSFSFGVNNDVEVNLVSSYDYAKMIGDIVTWSLWCDMNGEIHFENRKPYLMPGPSSGQIGDDVDESDPIACPPIITINDFTVINAFYDRNEKELRNRVVVYGDGDVKADYSNPLSYDPFDKTEKQILPVGFYKSVIASYAFIGEQSVADKTADYNLRLLNRLTEKVSVSCEGNHIFEPRKIMAISETYTGISGNWYIFGCNHNFSRAGYTVELDLRR
jgi:hypothetical protein